MTLDVEDLEADATPEDLMLSYVSGEKGKVCLSCCVQLHVSHIQCLLMSYTVASVGLTPQA